MQQQEVCTRLLPYFRCQGCRNKRRQEEKEEISCWQYTQNASTCYGSANGLGNLS